MTDYTARQPQGIPAGGQFAPTAHTEPKISLDAAPGAAGIIAANTAPVSLRYVAYDDRLTDEQMNMILAGQWNDAENDVDERFSDNAYEEAVTIARTELDEAVAEGRFDREWDELDQDEQDAARYAVEERDDSDPVKDLLRNTPDQLMRTSLGTPENLLKDRSAVLGSHLDDGGFEARQKAVSDLLAAAGMDTSAAGVQDEIRALVNEGPYDWHEGVQLDVIWYGGLEDAVSTPRSDSEADGQKVLEFATPHVLLIDKWNGSGHEVVIPAPLTRTLTRVQDDQETPQTGRAYLDKGAGGYGWDEVAGVYKPAYKAGAPSARWSA